MCGAAKPIYCCDAKPSGHPAHSRNTLLISFSQALRTKDFVITVELPLRPESTRESLLAEAAPLAARVDAFLLTDNQHGEPHMAPSYAAQILQSDGKAPITADH